MGFYTKNDRKEYYGKDSIEAAVRLELLDREFEEQRNKEERIKSLNPLERSILEQVFAEERERGTVVLPENLRNHGILYLAQHYSTNYPYLERICSLVKEFRSGKKSLFFLPPDFQSATFEGFKTSCEGQEVAWNLLTYFGSNPARGLYLWGNYGTGKTHLISAFARGLKAELILGYAQRIDDFVRGTLREHTSIFNELNILGERLEKVKNLFDGTMRYETEKSMKEYFVTLQNGIDNCFRKEFKKPLYHSSDLAFATFDDLFDRRGEEGFISDFLGRRIMIIDDIHPKGDLTRMDFIQRVVEYRYNNVRTGATFITSNLPPDQLLVNTNYSKEVADRVHSRLREMCMPIHFDTGDYRLKIAQRADEEMLALARELRELAASKKA